MPKRTTFVLLVARPGPIRDGLRALLSALPQVDTVGQVRESSAATTGAAEFQPALVIIDGGIAGLNPAALVQDIKAVSAHTRCLVLAQDVPQQQAAEAAVADAALLIGSSADDLLPTIARLVQI